MNDFIAQTYCAIGAGSEGRIVNRPSELEYRKDRAYERLTKIRYADYPGFLRLSKAVFAIGAKFPEDPSAASLVSYCHALNGDWGDAVASMEETIRLENGENLDSWMDLGHFLRKLPGREAESTRILLSPESYVRTPA